METNTRSKEAQAIINERLGKFFSEEQLSYLDDLGIEVLNDYFSTAELRDLKEAPGNVIKGFVDRKSGNEVKRRLTHITEDELESLMDWYKDNCTDIEEVVDPLTKEVIALEVKHKTMRNSTKVHWDGRFVIAVGDRLASTRTRLDGVVGYQSALQLQNPEFVEAWSAFYEERDKRLAAYRKKTDKHKAEYESKVQKIQEKYAEELRQFSIDESNYDSYKQGFSKKVKKPVEPKLEIPEYKPAATFEEPERPDIPQFLPPADTRWAAIETELIDENHIMSTISNDDIMRVKNHIDSTGYKKPVKKVKNGYEVDGFILRKVK